MLRKAIKVLGIVILVSASFGSFLYMNSTNLKIGLSEGLVFEQSELLPDEQTIATPVGAVAEKAIIIAKCFLFPSE